MDITWYDTNLSFKDDALLAVLIPWNLQRDIFFCTALADCHQPNEWHKVQVVHCLANWFIICGHPQVSSVVKPFDRSGFLSSCEVLHRWSLWDDWPYQTVKCWLHLGGQLIIWVSIYCNMWCRPAQQMVDGMQDLLRLLLVVWQISQMRCVKPPSRPVHVWRDTVVVVVVAVAAVVVVIRILASFNMCIYVYDLNFNWSKEV